VKSTTQNRGHGICGALALLLAAAAGAATFSVDRFDDSTASLCSPLIANDCALRGAILEANSNPGDDVVRLQAGTYTLSIPGADENEGQTGDLDVTDTVLVVGRGPELTVVDAGGVNDRVFDMRTPGKRLTLRGLTVTGGSPDAGVGGGILTQEGSLRLETCVVTGNELLGGGDGSAVASVADGPGDLTEIVDSWITGNTGQWAAVSLAVAHLERTTASGNTGTNLNASVVSIRGAGSSVQDSTVGDNSVGAHGVLGIHGTGIEIRSSTLANPGGNALYVSSAGSATLDNTLLVGSCLLQGQLTTLGGNLEGPGDTCLLGGSDLVNVPDPGLSSLGFFGGPAPVYQPLASSPAVDAAIAAPGCPALDQRGLSRPRDGDGNGSAVCDIGAAELAGAGEIFVETFDCGFTTGWSGAVY
jgi:hypothetical protein